LTETARNLERGGADFIVIPCNTAHYFYNYVAKAVSIPVLHMIREVAKATQTTLPKCKKAGLLGTSGTVATNLYQTEFKKIGVEVIVPDAKNQAKVMDAILLIKSGSFKAKAKAKLKEIGNMLIEEKGAESIILGCTDIPVVISQKDFDLPVFDSNLILAMETVIFAQQVAKH
jgi:aspartate racemase